ncbi:MAG: hypothetical protein AVDCRST_MAG11-2132, partial [uncultured Gemmatimonadaceae bacterium]
RLRDDPAAEEGGRRAHARLRRARRLPVRDVRRDRDAGARDRGARRGHRRVVLRRHAGRRRRGRADELGARLRVPGRARGAGALHQLDERHRRAPGQRPGAPAAARLVLPLRVLGEVRPRGLDARAGPPLGDRRLLRGDDELQQGAAEARGDGVSFGGRRAVGEVHPRRLRQGVVDVPRGPRSRGRAARHREPAHRPRAARELARLPPDPQQRAVPGREEEAAEDL